MPNQHDASMTAPEEPHDGHSSVSGNEPAVKTERPEVLFPSQLLKSHHMAVPPVRLLAENMPVAQADASESGNTTFASYSTSSETSQHSFAERANALINKSLGRESEGSSVVEPNSILGESGRLYHGYEDGKYYLPNDAAEQDRLDFQHKMFEILFDGWLSLAPMEFVPNYVLDIGTGTGIWAMEFAEKYPSSYVIGTDLSRIQAEPRVPNCAFVQDDAETKQWVYPLPSLESHYCQGPECEHLITFDYVHLRAMFSCFDDPRVVMRRAFDNLEPGGWIELQDATFEMLQANSTYEGTAMIRVADGCIRGAAALGRDILVAKKYKDWLEEVGFTDVTERKFFVPFTPWAEHPKLRQLGQYQQKNVQEGARGFSWKMLRAGGMEPDDIELLVSQLETEVYEEKNHPYSYIYAVFGRKPLDHPTRVKTE